MGIIDEEKEEKLHKKHEQLTEIIYNTPGMLPSRYVYILTNLCNLNCDFCYMRRDYRKDSLTTKDWINLSKQLPDYARVTLTGGEPFVFKDFKEVFSCVAEYFDCNIITNGLLLTNSLSEFLLSFPKFGVLSISIDDIGNKIRNVKPEKWHKVEKEIKYFLKKRDEINSNCIFDTKTTVLDENVEELFNIHKYCVEELGCDYHVFHFLKGSPVQHADYMFELKDIFKKYKAKPYKKLEIIREQFEKIQEYNIKTGKISFLHPKVGSLISKEPLSKLHYMNAPFHIKENYFPCKYPWSSVHINVDGNLFPCLAIPTGNVKKTSLDKIINGESMTEFREVIRKEGTVNACNHCGWSKPK